MTTVNDRSMSTCDLLVIGSGAGGLSTAITAKKARARRDRAREGSRISAARPRSRAACCGFRGNRHAKHADIRPTRARPCALHAARDRRASTTQAAVEAFLDNGPRMVEFFERETEVEVRADALSRLPPRRAGRRRRRPLDRRRALRHARGLGKDMARLRPPLKTITFIGMMFNSSNADLKHFFRATKSLASVVVCRQAAGEPSEGTGALSARRAGDERQRARGAAREVGARPRHSDPHDTPARRSCSIEDGRVSGARRRGTARRAAHHGASRRGAGMRRLSARCRAHRAGLSASAARRRASVAHARRQHRRRRCSMAERVGGRVDIRFEDSPPPGCRSRACRCGDGEIGVFPHLLDRYKPGIIGVLRERQALHQRIELVPRRRRGDDRRLRGPARDGDVAGLRSRDDRASTASAMPSPRRCRSAACCATAISSRASTLAELARNAGIDAAGARSHGARVQPRRERRARPAFGRGSTSFNRYLGRPRAPAQPLRRADRQGAVLRGQGGDGRPRHLRRPRDQRRRRRCCKRRRQPIAGPLRRRQRPRQHHGRQLSRRRHHARAEHDLRLSHRDRIIAGPGADAQRRHQRIEERSMSAQTPGRPPHLHDPAAQDGRVHRGVRPARDANPAQVSRPPVGF